MQNTAATLMKWTQYENKVEAFWWFSSVPYNAVTVWLPVVDETGRTHRLEETCNEWPVTTNVDGVPCYRTVYDIPPELEGVLLIPPGDPTFGGGGRQFQIPEGGFMYVDANGIMRQGKTEVTVLDDGAGTVFKIYHQGGVAVKFELNGVELEDGEVIICE